MSTSFIILRSSPLYPLFPFSPQGAAPAPSPSHSTLAPPPLTHPDAFQIHIGDKITLNVSGEWDTRSAQITLGSNVVAQVGPDVININAAEDLADAKGHSRDEIRAYRYRVDVAPGVDLVLMAVACICLDMTFYRTL